jgi:hypothetical protein
MGNADKTTAFFDKVAYNKTDVKGLKSVLVKTKGHEKLRTVMLLSSV